MKTGNGKKTGDGKIRNLVAKRIHCLSADLSRSLFVLKRGHGLTGSDVRVAYTGNPENSKQEKYTVSVKFDWKG